MKCDGRMMVRTPNAMDYLDYFEHTYVRKPIYEAATESAMFQLVRIKEYKDPMFSPRQWSMHQAVKTKKAKTNNVCEGWNHAFRSLVGHDHPCLWKVS